MNFLFCLFLVGGAVFGGVFSLLFFRRSAWPVTLGIGIGVGAGYSNCRHQFFRHGSHRPPFGRPPWGGGRPWWPGYGKGGEFQQSPCHQETKLPKEGDLTAVNSTENHWFQSEQDNNWPCTRYFEPPEAVGLTWWKDFVDQEVILKSRDHSNSFYSQPRNFLISTLKNIFLRFHFEHS